MFKKKEKQKEITVRIEVPNGGSIEQNCKDYASAMEFVNKVSEGRSNVTYELDFNDTDHLTDSEKQRLNQMLLLDEINDYIGLKNDTGH